MKCPKCLFDNPEGAKYCNECGNKLDLICQLCGKLNLPDSKFCNECGKRFEEIGGTKSELAFESERKNVTVLFSDLSGYTAMTERLDPEDVREIISRIFGEIAQVVTKYEGFIERFVGDAAMAVFGVPKTHEDDPVRAIRAAREIHDVVEAINPQLEEKVGQPLSMHTGIDTGLVVTGEVNLEKGIHGITGNPANLASRLQTVAEMGEILVSQETYRHAEGYFIFERVEPVIVKGREEPLNAYRVLASSTRRTRFDVSEERGLTPFVGRKRELELLLHAFEHTKDGIGQAFSIVSEAGVGKSRLLYEFRKAVANEDVTFLEGRCLSYSSGIAYHPVIDILKSNFDIKGGDEDATIVEKVKNGLKELGTEEAVTLPYLLELLSVEDSGIDMIPVSPEARKELIIDALKRIAFRGSEIRPLILAIEDLHWIDKSSEDTLKDLLDSISGSRVFLILTYRPEFIHTWGGRSYHNQLTLGRLSNWESLAMISHLLQTEHIHKDLEALILEKTEGIPFFIEEFVKSFKDLKIIEKKDKYYLAKDIQAVTVPSTIQDVIMARVDSLPKSAKEVLQTGSVIGREFSYELIKQVTGLPEQGLLSYLYHSKDSELLYERGIYPQSTYVFKHALTHDVVYDSILAKRRKKLHEDIGNAIEILCQKHIEEHYGLLAGHFVESENYEKGAHYSERAAKKAQKAASFKEAIEYAKMRVICLESLPKTDAILKEIIDTRTVLARYYMTLNLHVEAKEAVEPIIDSAIELNYQRQLPGIFLATGIYNLWIEEDYPLAFRYLKDVLEISKAVEDNVSLWFANYFLGCHLSWNCEFERSFEHLQGSLHMSDKANNPLGIASTKSAISAHNHILTGNIDLAHHTSAESLEIAKESQDIYVKGMAYTGHGISCYCKGLFDEAENHLFKGWTYCEKTAQVTFGALASFWLGFMYFDKKDYEKAENYHRKSISILEAARLSPSWINAHKLCLTRAEVLNNKKEIDLSQLSKYYEKNKLKICQGWNARYIAEIFLNIDDQHISDAEDWVRKAIETNKNNSMMWFLAHDYVFYSGLLKRKGDQLEAEAKMKKAIEIFKECGADGHLRRAEKELDSLS